MFSRVRIAIRFFFLGLAVGVLLAPRSGQETRRLVRERADRLLNDLLDAATLGTYDNGTGGQAAQTDGAADASADAPKPAANGRRTRSTSTASAS
ncbi:MAG: YtxH domain-containing protein [Chloroflexota bacterium]